MGTWEKKWFLITTVSNMSVLQIAFISASLLVSTVFGSPGGAPLEACETMTPGHGPEPQNSTAPFTTVPQSNSIDAGSSVELILSGTETFRGFLVLALSGSVAGPVGTFSGVSDGRTLNCSGTVASGATHSSRTDKSSVSVTWTPPQVSTVPSYSTRRSSTTSAPTGWQYLLLASPSTETMRRHRPVS